jgi:VanZ family protein
MGKIFKYFQTHPSKAVLIASIWTAFILFACFIPGSTLPKVAIPLIDKWVHFVIFAGFSFLWYFPFKKVNFFNATLLIVLSFGLGYLVEKIQGSGWVINRSYEWNDVVADTLGGVIGVLLFHVANFFFKRKD